MKKDGGIIKNWQIHNLTTPPDVLAERYPEVTDGKARILTGTVVSGHYRFEDGWHMRSAMIAKYDEENGIVESVSGTVYKLEGPEGDPVLGNEDAGDFVSRIFY